MAFLGIVTDAEAQNEPKWVEYDKDGFEGVRFLIRPKTRTALSRIRANVDREMKFAKRKDDHAREEAMTRAFAQYLLEDWEGVYDAGTKEPLPCTPEMKQAAFQSIELAVFIIERATDLALVAIEDDEKNFNASSAGTSARTREKTSAEVHAINTVDA